MHSRINSDEGSHRTKDPHEHHTQRLHRHRRTDPDHPPTALKEGDTFALVGNNSPLTILAKRRHLQPLWLLDLEGHASPITLRDDEPIRPLQMLRAFDLACQLCTRTRRRVLDLPVHGIPQAWVCDQH